jgi:hypothetical protein
MNKEKTLELIEQQIRDGMTEGNMHVCIRDTGRLIGGYLAGGIFDMSDLAYFNQKISAAANNPEQAEKQFKQAVEYGRQEPIIEQDQNDTPIPWDYKPQRPQKQQPEPLPEIIDSKWIQPEDIPDPKQSELATQEPQGSCYRSLIDQAVLIPYSATMTRNTALGSGSTH